MDELKDKHVEIDERWLSEWFEFGFAELAAISPSTLPSTTTATTRA